MPAAKPRILLTNDDGFDALGLRHLLAALEDFAEVQVAAPLFNRSGSSYALSLHDPVPVIRRGPQAIVAGTPADCVILALHREDFLPWRPDLTVSGINYGGNLGYDTLYSGTVAAAAESCKRGVPAVAFSSVCLPEGNFPPAHLEDAAQIAARMVQKLLAGDGPPADLLNVNIPDLPADQVKEPLAAGLKKRHLPRPHVDLRREELHGLRSIRTSYNVSLAASHDDGLDLDVVKRGHVAVTPLRLDVAAYDEIDTVAGWLRELA
ncbi:MAG: 5'/3'-nucleotidase SurE [Betaproteobacteria bacterium AqS2]|uniref:5'-nucleotidase SurE n=1 Tax=Candidatus Amphirhobacter heronislandensis TaxID=1732024 RepID=A0A930UII1_9GAMM|nr:5'/3'-nucleotidase SurE [Betaproteobacteria bacterium AqS2]